MNEWIIEENSINPLKFKKYESLACMGNGYMGVRNSLEEEYTESCRSTFINGVFNTSKGETAELVALPDVTNLEIFVNGERFLMHELTTAMHKRFLDLKTGESIREISWFTKDRILVKICFKKFVSFVKKHVFAQKVTICCDKAAEVVVKSGINGKITNSGVQHFENAVLRNLDGDILSLNTKTQQSEVSVSVKAHLRLKKACERYIEKDRRSVFSCLKAQLAANETIELEKYAAYATSRDFEYKNTLDTDVDNDSLKYIKEAIASGFDVLLNENKENFLKFWEDNKITVKSDNTFYQKAVNFSLYHLRIMVNEDDNRLGIGAKALTGEGYKGHSFWDTEIFILPYYIYTKPQIARNLLEYRYSLLDISRKKAKEHGFLGAMYPWESAWYTDGETCPYLGEPDLLTGVQRVNQMGEIEVHIVADIAYGVWHYFCVTQDFDFMEKCGNEIILSTAEFWLSRVENKNGRFEILNVIGPDEYKDNVDNNAYTNYMAHFNLEVADKVLNTLSDMQKESLKACVDIEKLEAELKNVLEKLYVPGSDENGIIPQFDGFCELKPVETDRYKNQEKVGLIFKDFSFDEINKLRVCKQADMVMLFYLLRNLFDKETIEKNFRYYEDCTLHDSSLSMCIHSLVASRIGDLSFAEKLFSDCCAVDLGDKNDNSDNGIHSASIGGIWLSVVMGFGGAIVSDGVLKLEPVLPDGINEYSFPIEYKGTKLFITVNKDGTRIERKSGNAVKVLKNNKEQIY